MEKYSIEKITADNHRPGTPKEGYFVFQRLHPDFGWTGRRAVPSLKAAKVFAATLTPEGDIDYDKI